MSGTAEVFYSGSINPEFRQATVIELIQGRFLYFLKSAICSRKFESAVKTVKYR